ncbi:hypothetical protein D9M72_557560 [compost metagenome]
MLVDLLEQVLREIAAGKAQPRHVDRHRHGGHAGVPPLAHLAADAGQDPVVELVDLARLLGHGDELGRAHLAQRGMAPAA